jgi:hypothetical protein
VRIRLRRGGARDAADEQHAQAAAPPRHRPGKVIPQRGGVKPEVIPITIRYRGSQAMLGLLYAGFFAMNQGRLS